MWIGCLGGHDNVRPIRGRLQCYRLADATRRSSDENRFSGEFSAKVLIMIRLLEGGPADAALRGRQMISKICRNQITEIGNHRTN